MKRTRDGRSKKSIPLPESFLAEYPENFSQPQPLVFCQSDDGRKCHLETSSITYHFRTTLKALGFQWQAKEKYWIMMPHSHHTDLKLSSSSSSSSSSLKCSGGQDELLVVRRNQSSNIHRFCPVVAKLIRNIMPDYREKAQEVQDKRLKKLLREHLRSDLYRGLFLSKFDAFINYYSLTNVQRRFAKAIKEARYMPSVLLNIVFDYLGMETIVKIHHHHNNHHHHHDHHHHNNNNKLIVTENDRLVAHIPNQGFCFKCKRSLFETVDIPLKDGQVISRCVFCRRSFLL